MPTFAELRDALSQAWESHDYGFALFCMREILSRYRGAKSQSGLVDHLLGVAKYSNLAAAFDASDVLVAMDRAGKKSPRMRMDAEDLGDQRWQTLAAMRWLREAVERSGRIDLISLVAMAESERIGKVKSRLIWMEKAGGVHLIEDVVFAGPSPDAAFSPMGTEVDGVPLFKVYNASEWQMDDAQLSFFRQFEIRFRAGELVEPKEQWSYAFALLSKLEREHEGDTKALLCLYERLDRDYPDSPVAGLTLDEDADSFFERGDWQGGYDLLMPDVPMDIYLTLESVVADSRLRVATLEGWTTQSGKTTEAFRSRKADVDAALQDLLDAAHDEIGRSIVADLWHRLMDGRLPGARGPDIAEEFRGFITQEQIDDYLAHHDRSLRPLTSLLGLEPGYDSNLGDTSDVINWPAPWCHTYWFEQIVRARIRSLYRDAENIVRRDIGMPSVGEGWIAEVMLLRAVRDAFPDRRILHQGRPPWLGQQSLDIYLPDQNIGIEYQGLQHTRPVDLFGGPLAFERQLERDARKQDLCKTNGCYLIEVHPGYELDEVISRIQVAIDQPRRSPRGA